MGTTQDTPEHQPFRLPDMSVGDPDDPNPLEGWTWEELRDVIYEDSWRAAVDRRVGAEVRGVER